MEGKRCNLYHPPVHFYFVTFHKSYTEHFYREICGSLSSVFEDSCLLGFPSFLKFFTVFYQQSNNCDVQNQWQQEQKSALLDDAAIFWEYQ
jgi:hypothetical protein